MINYISIFLTAFLQIFFVSMQSYQIAHMKDITHIEIKIFIVSALISICWLYNVNRSIKNCKLSKLCYILGVSFGAVLGPKFGIILDLII